MRPFGKEQANGVYNCEASRDDNCTNYLFWPFVLYLCMIMISFFILWFCLSDTGVFVLCRFCLLLCTFLDSYPRQNLCVDLQKYLFVYRS